MGASDKNVINNNARDGCSGVAGVDNEDKNSRNGSNGDDDNNNNNAEMIIDREKGLHLLVHKKWLKDSDVWWDIFVRNVRWHRVKYKSNRFGKECETPCWTTFYGGRECVAPYTPVPSWLQPLVERVSSHKRLNGAKFNAMLVRLYFDGSDEIAWHTDGRTFLGKAPTIASLSLGATVKFQLRRMNNVWPCGGGDDGIDRATPQREVLLGDGDLFAMLGSTQQFWHHRVPKTKGRKPRININFRYILPGPDAKRGQKTYYKYMVHGDAKRPRSFTFDEIMKRSGSLLNFMQTMAKPQTRPAIGNNGTPAAVAAVSAPSSWQCNACTYIHGESRMNYLACEVCGTIRKTTSPPTTTERAPKKRRKASSSKESKHTSLLMSMLKKK